MIKNIFTLCLFMLFTFNIALSQDYNKKGFQRLYELKGDSVMFNISSLATKGGNFFSLNSFEDSSDTIDIRSLVITSYNEKGNLVKSTRIDSINGEMFDIALNNGDIILDDKANAYAVANIIDGGNSKSFVFSLKANREARWSYTIDFNSNRIEMDLLNDTTLLVYYNNIDDASFSLAALDTMGNTKNTFKGTITDTVSTQYLVSGTELKSVDTSFTLVGNLSSQLGNEAFYTRLDHNFDVLASRKYNETAHSITIENVDRSNDKAIIISGQSTNASDTSGYVARLDSLGMPIWQKKLTTNLDVFTDQRSTITGQAVNSDGDVYVSGYIKSTIADSTTLFISKLDVKNGDVKNFYLFSTTTPYGNDIAELSSMADGGVAYSGTFTKNEGTFTGLINMNKDGEASFCGGVYSGMPFEDFMLNTDTLLVNLSDGDVLNEASIVTRDFTSYDVTTISPFTNIYCPNEEINEIIGEEVDGAVNYNWSPLPDTTATITVTKEGEYPRIVSIGEDYCYNLCDTSMLQRSKVPVLSLNYGLDCKDQVKKYLITPSIDEGRPAFSFVWSTNEVTPTISVFPGTYSLTITDQCGDTANATAVVTELASTLTINPNFQTVCNSQSKSYTVISNATGGISPYIYQWDNGESTTSISVSEVGNYSITVTDQCGDEITDIAIVTGGPVELNVSIEGNIEDYCENGTTELIAEVTNGKSPLTYEWSTSETAMSIDASELIEYSVSVTDNCGDTGEASFKDLANLKGLQWPSLFFPIRGELTNEENRTFGPKNDCPTLIPVSYELHIYNRWGQEVFSSDAIENEWDGKLSSGDNAPVDTYIFQAIYDYGEGKINAQGDVTIIR